MMSCTPWSTPQPPHLGGYPRRRLRQESMPFAHLIPKTSNGGYERRSQFDGTVGRLSLSNNFRVTIGGTTVDSGQTWPRANSGS